MRIKTDVGRVAIGMALLTCSLEVCAEDFAIVDGGENVLVTVSNSCASVAVSSEKVTALEFCEVASSLYNRRLKNKIVNGMGLNDNEVALLELVAVAQQDAIIAFYTTFLSECNRNLYDRGVPDSLYSINDGVDFVRVQLIGRFVAQVDNQSSCRASISDFASVYGDLRGKYMMDVYSDIVRGNVSGEVIPKTWDMLQNWIPVWQLVYTTHHIATRSTQIGRCLSARRYMTGTPQQHQMRWNALIDGIDDIAVSHQDLLKDISSGIRSSSLVDEKTKSALRSLLVKLTRSADVHLRRYYHSFYDLPLVLQAFKARGRIEKAKGFFNDDESEFKNAVSDFALAIAGQKMLLKIMSFYSASCYSELIEVLHDELGDTDFSQFKNECRLFSVSLESVNSVPSNEVRQCK